MVQKKTKSQSAASRAQFVQIAPSKPVVVGSAVANQLHHEGRWPPNDMTKLMGADYHYNQFTLANFLKAVQWNLAHGEPSYTFQFDESFIIKALQMNVATLMAAINSATN